MLPTSLITLISTVIILYGVTILFFTIIVAGRKSRFPKSLPTSSPGVSVIIPFRNEEHNLKPLLQSLKNQNYKGKWEIILVDDHSSDKGPKIVKEMQNEFNTVPLHLIQPESSHSSLTSKQQALESGVSSAAHQLIAFTDADMVLHPQWLENLVHSQHATQKDLIFGHTIIKKPEKAFGMLEAFQLEFLFSFAYAFFKADLTGSCMGNNLLVVKDSYLRSGGQSAIGYNIVEDRALLELFRRKGLKTGAAEPFLPLATTHPSRSLNQFYHQIRRWAAGGCHPGSNLFAAGILFSVQNLLFLFSVLGFMPLIISTLSFTNFFLNWIFLILTFRKIHSPFRTLLFPLYYIFLIAETILFGFSLLFRPRIEWKNKTVQ
ncbi:MAG: glycosyltransferase [Chitinispirillaceae bacterium]